MKSDGQYRQQAYKIIVYRQVEQLTNILKQLDHAKQVQEIQKVVQKAVQSIPQEQKDS